MIISTFILLIILISCKNLYKEKSIEDLIFKKGKRIFTIWSISVISMVVLVQSLIIFDVYQVGFNIHSQLEELEEVSIQNEVVDLGDNYIVKTIDNNEISIPKKFTIVEKGNSPLLKRYKNTGYMEKTTLNPIKDFIIKDLFLDKLVNLYSIEDLDDKGEILSYKLILK